MNLPPNTPLLNILKNVRIGNYVVPDLTPPSIAGTGAMLVAAFVFAGTSAQTVSGTGSMAVQAFTISGTSTQSETGAGSLAVGSPAFSGTSSQTESGSGGLTLASLSFSGTSSQSGSGTGSMAAPFPSLNFGDNVFLAAPQFSGTGNIANPGTGTGSIAVGTPQFAGSGIAGTIGSGGSALATPFFTVSAAVQVSGSGGMSFALSLSATGSVPVDTTIRISPFGFKRHPKSVAVSFIPPAVSSSRVSVFRKRKALAQKWASLHSLSVQGNLESPQMSGVGQVYEKGKAPIVGTTGLSPLAMEGTGSVADPVIKPPKEPDSDLAIIAALLAMGEE